MLARMRHKRMIASRNPSADLWQRREVRLECSLPPVVSGNPIQDRDWPLSLIVSMALHIVLLFALAFFSTEELLEPRAHILESRWNLPVSKQVDFATTESIVLTQSLRRKTTGQTNGQSLTRFSPSADEIVVSFRSNDSSIASALFGNTQDIGDLTESVVRSVPTTAAAHKGSGNSGDSNVAADGGAGGFFGVKPEAHRFVYVLDASRSMNHPVPGEAGTRFKQMQLELLRAITDLDSESLFFVVFFNDEAIPMPAHGLEPATPTAQKNCLDWMVHIKADGKTDPIPAFAIAQQLRSEIIYFLTDGWFKKKTADELLRLSRGTATIHTFSFAVEMKPDVREAAALIQASDLRAAKRRFSDEVVRKAREYVQSERLLKELAHRTGGAYHLIQ